MIVEAIDADHRTLIAAKNHPIAIVGINPQLMVIVAARRSLERFAEAAAAIARPVNAGIRRVHKVSVFGIHHNLAEIPAASPNPSIARGLGEGRTGVVRAVESTLFGVDDCVHSIPIRRRYRDADAAETFGWQTGSNLLPVRPAVCRFVEAAARPVGWWIDGPGRT